MKTADHILTSLGGVAEVARKLGLPLTTVQGWKDANFVPEWRRPALIKLAKAKKKPLADDDFPTAEQRISRKKVAA
jgi:hypothetical protein